MQPFQAGLEMRIDQQDWRGAAVDANNLSELHLIRGAVSEAVAIAQRGVDFADQSKGQFEQISNRTTWADALFQADDYAATGNLFAKAEQIQQDRQPSYPQLYSVPGFRYCAWWLAAGDWAQVQQRATQTLKIAKQHLGLLELALDQVSLGRASLQQALALCLPTHANTEPPNDSVPLAPDAQLWLPEQMAQITLSTRTQITDALSKAQDWLDQAVSSLREAAYEDHIPRGLLARAAAARYRAAFLSDSATVSLACSQAAEDLREVADSASRCGMLLFLVDYHLEAARWGLTFPDLLCTDDWAGPTGEVSEFGELCAKDHLARAEKLMAQTGYAAPQAAMAHLRELCA